MMNNSIVFDIDGTVADYSHRLYLVTGEVKDYDQFYEASVLDTPINPIIAIALALRARGYEIICATGRPERCRRDTLKWLAANAMPCDKLVMRKEKDFSSADKLKSKWLKSGELGNPLVVFEDDPKVVKMFRKKGIKVCQVAEPIT